MNDPSRRATTVCEVLVSILALGVLFSLVLPVFARAGSAADVDGSLNNLHTLAVAHTLYAADWNGRQVTTTDDLISSYGPHPGAALPEFANQTGFGHPNVNAGWGPGGGGVSVMYRYVLDVNDSGYGVHEWAVNPIVFGGSPAGLRYFGMFRMVHAHRPFHFYAGGSRYYDPVFYAPADNPPLSYAAPAFDEPWEFVPDSYTNGVQVWSSYCMSPAAMYKPEVFRHPDDGGWQDPWQIDDAFTSPSLSQARYPNLKTHMMEHHWLQNAPADNCNPNFIGPYDGCEPYYFNHGLASAPATLFYDASVRLLSNVEAKAADNLLIAQTGHGVWSRDTPFGSDGYFNEYAVEDVGLSHHILTTDGILGRDTLPPGAAAVRGAGEVCAGRREVRMRLARGMKIMLRLLPIGGILFVMVVTVSDVHGEERFWNDPGGGNFGNAGNWDDGGGPVPDFDDVCTFDLEAMYDVFFLDSQATDRVIIRAGHVRFLMANEVEYVLLSPLSTLPGITVADLSGSMATLDLTANEPDMTAAFVRVGLEAGSDGSLLLAGDESRMMLTQHLHIGDEGTGGLSVSDRAFVQSRVGIIGAAATGAGTADISGVNSEWIIDDDLTVAGNGSAMLAVSDGALLSSGDASAAIQDGSSATVNISGPGASWFIAGSLDFGVNGVASMTIEGGGDVFALGFATIGTFEPFLPGETGGVGDVTVRDRNSLWWVEGDLHVGFAGDGTLVLSRGGTVRVGGDLYDNVDVGLSRLVFELGSADDYIAPAIYVVGDSSAFDDAEVVLVDGYVPDAGDRFALIETGGSAGSLGLSLPLLDNPYHEWLVTETGDAVLIEVVVVCAADLNGDDETDFDDLTILLGLWGPCSAPCIGDVANDDGIVDFDDLTVLLGLWGPCRGR